MNKNKITNEYMTLVSKAPESLVINSELEWEINLTANRDIPKGMNIKITVPAYQHQRSEEYLQCYDYWKPNYIYAMPSDDVIKLRTEVEKVKTGFSHVKSWDDSSRVAIITSHSDIKQGQGFTIKFGGISKPFVKGECTPSRCGQFAYHKDGTKLNYLVEADYPGNGEYCTEEVLGPIKIFPEKPYKIVITSNNTVQPNQEVKATILAKDRFNNPVLDYDTSDIKLMIINLETGESKPLVKVENEFTAQLDKIGFYEITACSTDLKAENSVVYCDENIQPIFWGDTHVHSNLTANIRDNDGGATPEQCYWYSKNVSKIDFVCLIEQTFLFDEDDVNLGKSTWAKMIEEAKKNYVPDKFIPFSGFELHGPRGDTVVFFQDELSADDYPDTGVKTIPDVWEHYKHKQFMTVPHLHRYCNGRPNLDQQDKVNVGFDLKKWEPSSHNETLCEVFSSQWGTFESQNSPKVLKALDNVEGNTVAEFLSMGKQWGMTASSDGHDGNPGYGGLTGVYSDKLTRQSLFESLKNRATIATTHTRAVLDFRLNDNAMGTFAKCSPNATIRINAVSPKLIQKIQVNKNGKVFKIYYCKNKYAKIIDDIGETQRGDYFYVKMILEDYDIVWGSSVFVNENK